MTTRQSESYETAFSGLESGIFTALETYSNVHRGSGHYSQVTTTLFEKAREIVSEYLGLEKRKHLLIFCSGRGEALLRANLSVISSVSSSDIGLPLGVRALAVNKRSMPEKVKFLAGGGTAKLISSKWAIWEDGPAAFEAGTPPVINIIAFAKALQLVKKYGRSVFSDYKTGLIPAGILLFEDEFSGLSGKELLEACRKTIIGIGTPVPTTEGVRPYLNLDYCSSTPALKQSWDVFREMLHQPLTGRSDIIDEVRMICRKFFKAPENEYEIIFTSNATEALNIAASGFRPSSDEGTEPVILSTILEHSSNDLPWREINRVSVLRIPVGKSGLIDLNDTEELLARYNLRKTEGRKRIELITVSGASNVLGIFNNIEELSRLAHKYGAGILVDGAQLAAHRNIDMHSAGTDLLVFSAHKVYSPFGSGALIARKGILNFTNEESENIRASGEENLAGIAALGKGVSVLQDIGPDIIAEEEQVLTAKTLRVMNKLNGIRIFGISDPDDPDFSRKGPVIPFSLKEPWPHKLGPALAERGGIGIRFGCHCAHILVKHIVGVGPKLESFQKVLATVVPGIRFPGVARVSLGLGNTEQDISHFIYVIKEITEVPGSNNKEIRQKINEFIKTSAEKVFA